MKTRRKIALIGAGNIGGTLALFALERGLGDVVMFDVADGVAAGKALDLTHAAPVLGTSVAVKGTTDYKDIEGADVVIITAGIPRKPGMSRDDLIATNAGIMKTVAQGVKQYAANAFVIVVSNPLDVMVTLCQKETGFPHERVVGMAGVLDSARYRAHIAEELKISPTSVSAFVLGGHGDDMVPIRSYTTVNGVPVAQLIPGDRLDAIEKRVRGSGGEVVALLKTGSAFYSPAISAIEMAESYLFDQKKVIPCAAYLRGEYGFKDLYMGVPTIIGAKGVEKVVEIEMTEKEKQELAVSASHVRDLVASLNK
ncbi:malate dehydrogenase [bacterium]|nr:malate dehydrogenase [bacterium]